MRMDQKHKKLSLMIGVALSAGICFSMNPMEAYAFTSVGYSEFKNGSEDSQVTQGIYTVTKHDGTKETFTDADKAVEAALESLKGETEASAIDFGQWKDINNATANDKIAAFQQALAAKDVVVAKGQTLGLTQADGSAVALTAGASGEGTVNIGTDGTIKVSSDMASIGVSGTTDVKLEVADGATLGTVAVTEADATVDVSGAGKITALGTSGDCKVNGETEIGTLGVQGKLTSDGDLNVGALAASGGVDMAGDLNASGVVNVTGDLKAGNVTAGSVTAGSVTADVTADSLNITDTGELEIDSSAKAWNVGTLTTGGKLTVSDASKLTAKSIESTGDLEVSDTANALGADSLKSGGALTISGGAKVTATDISSTGAMTIGNTEDIAAGANISAGDLTVTTGDLDAGTLTVNGALSTTGSVTADTVKFGRGASIGGSASSDTPVEIKANNIVIDTTKMTKDDVAKLKIASKTDGGTVNVKVVSSDGSVSDELKQAIQDAAGDSNVTISATSEAAEAAKSGADEAIKAADEALAKANPLAAKDPAEIAKANPFVTKLPSASEIAAVQNLKVDDSVTTGLTDAITSLDTQIEAAETAGNTYLKAELESKKAELQSKVASLSASGMQAKAAELTAAVQQAGKTAAAPGVTSARAAAVIANVMTANVTTRTNELRGYASAIDEGRPAPDNVWFQYKHTNMDVDNGDVYGTSTIKTNNYQLGYDAKVGPNDYLGAYIGTTTGSAEFTGPAASDKADIENSIDFGIYGTHMLPNDQYFDYMVHTGKFDNKLYGESWGTKDTGAMLGYGAKIAASDRLTWNPYVQLAYDKISVDSYMAGQNHISSDDSDNWTAKLGINLLDASGLYGGLAYSRGLSGSYNAYINGVPMPTQDNNANVLYLSLGYRANLDKNVFLDLSMEKTFADYKGWSAAGKINFYF